MSCTSPTSTKATPSGETDWVSPATLPARAISRLPAALARFPTSTSPLLARPESDPAFGLFFEAFNVFNTGNFGNQFQNVTGTPDFGRPVNFFGATGFSEPLGIPFQAQLGVRFSF